MEPRQRESHWKDTRARRRLLGESTWLARKEGGCDSGRSSGMAQAGRKKPVEERATHHRPLRYQP